MTDEQRKLNDEAKKIIDQYRKTISENIIPFGEIMGNKRFIDEFDGNIFNLYNYCLEHKVKWENVLHFKYNPNYTY